MARCTPVESEEKEGSAIGQDERPTEENVLENDSLTSGQDDRHPVNEDPDLYHLNDTQNNNLLVHCSVENESFLDNSGLELLAGVAGLHSRYSPAAADGYEKVGHRFPFELKASSITDLLRTNDDLKYVTGIPTFDQLEELVALVERVLVRHNSKPKFSCDFREIMLLTLMKLRLNLDFLFLGILFQISNVTASSYFHYMIEVLHTCLSPAVPWMSQENVRATMPYPFKKFPKTRVVLDCTEVSVQIPECVSCRIRTYSHYKKGHTVKVLLVIAPCGMITYVSVGYGGRCSDTFIVKDSKILLKLDLGDAVMVDRGFLIDKDCEELGLVLIRPPFLRGKFRFSEQEAQHTNTIASARVHVERAIQRVKKFRILKGTIPTSMLGAVDKILVIVSGLVNLQNPIINDERGKTKKLALQDAILEKEQLRAIF